MIKFIAEDGGSPEHERNDCTVRALSIATNTPYSHAYNILLNFGRKPNHGTNIRKFFKNNRVIFGHSFTKLSFRKQITLNKFIKKYTTGVFYVRISKHVFVIKDSITYDSVKPKQFCRITDAWKVHKIE